MGSTFDETKFIMKKYNIKPNKGLGQNFIIDDEVIEDIVKGANVTKEDLVIEIGPGIGSLTKILLENAKKVICIELDRKMIKLLNDRFFMYKNLELINQDILKIDLQKLIKEEKSKSEIRNVKIVANLPYYITTPIIMKLVEENLDIESITVMIQKEVAERLIAIPGTRNAGAITYTVYYNCESEKIREVDRTCFIPEPEVTSEVIKLKIREQKSVNVTNEKIMFNIIKSAYMQRRKTLLNSLTNVGFFKNKEQGINILKKLGLREDIRPENLSIEDFARLSDVFMKNLKK